MRLVRRNNGIYYWQHADRRKTLETRKRSTATRRFGEFCRIVERGQWPRGRYPWATGNVTPIAYAEAVDRYTADTQRESSQKKQIQVLLKAFQPNGGRLVSEITAADIEAHKARRLRSKRENTVASDLRHLSAFFNYAVRMDWTESNPVKGVKKPRGKSQQRAAYTKAEAKRLLAAADSEETRDLMLVALHCGLRNGELAHLQKQDVDLRSKAVTIREKRAAADGYAWRPKSLKSERTLPLNREALAAFRRLCARKEPLDLLFPSARGGVNAHLLRRIERIRKPAKVPDATLHGFRHTFVTWLLRAGVDLKTAQELAGHESIETTALYLHTDDATKRKAVRGLE